MEALITTFPGESIQFSSIDTDESGNIYVCRTRSKHVFQISPDGSRTELYNGELNFEADYGRVLWNKAYGVILDMKKPRVILGVSAGYSTHEKIWSTCIDDVGTQYRICCAPESYTAEHMICLYDIANQKVKYGYVTSLPKSLQLINMYIYMKPASVKFIGTNVYLISQGGFVFYNDKFLMRLWKNLRATQLFVLNNGTYVVKAYSSLTQYKRDEHIKTIAVPQNDVLTVTRNGDVIFTRKNNIYQIKAVFTLNCESLLNICLKFIKCSGHPYDLSNLPNDLLMKLKSIK